MTSTKYIPEGELLRNKEFLKWREELAATAAATTTSSRRNSGMCPTSSSSSTLGRVGSTASSISASLPERTTMFSDSDTGDHVFVKARPLVTLTRSPSSLLEDQQGEDEPDGYKGDRSGAPRTPASGVSLLGRNCEVVGTVDDSSSLVVVADTRSAPATRRRELDSTTRREGRKSPSPPSRSNSTTVAAATKRTQWSSHQYTTTVASPPPVVLPTTTNRTIHHSTDAGQEEPKQPTYMPDASSSSSSFTSTASCDIHHHHHRSEKKKGSSAEIVSSSSFRRSHDSRSPLQKPLRMTMSVGRYGDGIDGDRRGGGGGTETHADERDDTKKEMADSEMPLPRKEVPFTPSSTNEDEDEPPFPSPSNHLVVISTVVAPSDKNKSNGDRDSGECGEEPSPAQPVDQGQKSKTPEEKEEVIENSQIQSKSYSHKLPPSLVAKKAPLVQPKQQPVQYHHVFFEEMDREWKALIVYRIERLRSLHLANSMMMGGKSTSSSAGNVFVQKDQLLTFFGRSPATSVASPLATEDGAVLTSTTPSTKRALLTSNLRGEEDDHVNETKSAQSSSGLPVYARDFAELLVQTLNTKFQRTSNTKRSNTRKVKRCYGDAYRKCLSPKLDGNDDDDGDQVVEKAQVEVDTPEQHHVGGRVTGRSGTKKPIVDSEDEHEGCRDSPPRPTRTGIVAYLLSPSTKSSSDDEEELMDEPGGSGEDDDDERMYRHAGQNQNRCVHDKDDRVDKDVHDDVHLSVFCNDTWEWIMQEWLETSCRSPSDHDRQDGVKNVKRSKKEEDIQESRTSSAEDYHHTALERARFEKKDTTFIRVEDIRNAFSFLLPFTETSTAAAVPSKLQQRPPSENKKKKTNMVTMLDPTATIKNSRSLPRQGLHSIPQHTTFLEDELNKLMHQKHEQNNLPLKNTSSSCLLSELSSLVLTSGGIPGGLRRIAWGLLLQVLPTEQDDRAASSLNQRHQQEQQQTQCMSVEQLHGIAASFDVVTVEGYGSCMGEGEVERKDRNKQFETEYHQMRTQRKRPSALSKFLEECMAMSCEDQVANSTRYFPFWEEQIDGVVRCLAHCRGLIATPAVSSNKKTNKEQDCCRHDDMDNTRMVLEPFSMMVAPLVFVVGDSYTRRQPGITVQQGHQGPNISSSVASPTTHIGVGVTTSPNFSPYQASELFVYARVLHSVVWAGFTDLTIPTASLSYSSSTLRFPWLLQSLAVFEILTLRSRGCGPPERGYGNINGDGGVGSIQRAAMIKCRRELKLCPVVDVAAEWIISGFSLIGLSPFHLLALWDIVVSLACRPSSSRSALIQNHACFLGLVAAALFTFRAPLLLHDGCKTGAHGKRILGIVGPRTHRQQGSSSSAALPGGTDLDMMCIVIQFLEHC